ncbi:hypothetical protein FNW02_33115 [Komarekiella sp. 'clone 1']|uniref:Uncharacterized protein n=1 Tax=Komarekiella delphini-convector SJRDD-AB1 TaxID=2593771 RepID=A0AA40T3Y4_9NOST|nr:hypothetical protein [Komarekiella delphini-convector]MBD6620494.1 hypothetical protein [Komarekiella delphini-convector SJRDD-AB1]
MQQYIWNLLILGLGASTFIITPCNAQTPVESNSKNTNNISSTSSEQTPAIIELSDSASSTNSELPIFTEATPNSSVSSASIAATKPKPRIPIFSRVFPSPSMQQ